MNGKKLEEMTRFKYLRATLFKDGTCSAETLIRIASAMVAVARLNKIWRCSTLALRASSCCTSLLSLPSSSTAVKLGLRSLTLKKRTQVFETKCLRELLRISYLEQKINDWLRGKINFLVGPQGPLLAIVKKRKLAWFRNVTRHDSVSKTILNGTWRVGDAVVSRGNAGWTTTKSGHPCQCQNCSQALSAEKTGRGSLLNCPAYLPDDPVVQETELN